MTWPSSSFLSWAHDMRAVENTVTHWRAVLMMAIRQDTTEPLQRHDAIRRAVSAARDNSVSLDQLIDGMDYFDRERVWSALEPDHANG